MTSSVVVLTRLVRLGLAFATAIVLLQAQAGPPGTVVNDLLAVGESPRTLYAATDYGVFRSSDEGASWQPFSEGLPVDEFVVESIGGVEDQLFVAVDGAGVWRSRDQGPWVQTSDGIGDLQTLVVAVKPGDPQTLLAGTRTQGVFFSNNGGDGWIRPGDLTIAGHFPELDFSPTNPDRILGSAVRGLIVESTDGGQSWVGYPINDRIIFGGVAFDPADENVAYIASNVGLYRQAGPGQTPLLVSTTSGLVLNDVAIDPLNHDVFYASDQALGFIRSVDRGVTWTRPGGLPRSPGFALLALPGEPTRILAGAFGTGVFASTDQGATWSLSSTGLNSGNILSIAVDTRNAGVVYAAMSGGGMFKTTNAGATWSESRNGLSQFNPGRIAIDPADSNRIYSGSINPLNSQDGSIQRSDDGGASWTSVLSGIPVYSLALHPTDGQTIWIGTTSGPFASLLSLYRSGDRGENVEGVLGTLNIRGLATDPADGETVYAISEINGIYELIKTTDDGDQFFGSGQTTVQMYAVVVDPGDSNTVYLGTSAGVFRSTDAGASFTARNEGLPTDVAVASLSIDARDGAIYLATSSGLFKSTDGSASWFQIGEGLGGVLVRQVAIDPYTPGGLYAATAGAGVYRSTDGGKNWQPTGVTSGVISSEGIVGAFDFVGGGVAPGELVTIFGAEIGPAEGVAATELDPATGKLSTTLAGVRVFFNDIPAPLLFVRADQVNVQVPFEVAGLENVSVRVEFNGASTNAAEVAVLDAHPGLFPTAVNLDGSLNGENAATPAGQFALFYATGQGLTDPAVETGATPPTTEPFARPTAEVRVIIGGQEAQVYFAGLVAPYVGLLQMNVEIPAGLAPGRHDVELIIGGRSAGALGSVWVGPSGI